MYSYQVEQAIKAAAVLHDGQVRRGKVPIPYITHLFSVAQYLREFTDDEVPIIAALLHDTLEDTGYTLTELTDDFGPDVAEIVTALTEPTERDGQPLSWRDKKAAYALQLTQASEAAIMVAASDKIHNFRTLVEEYYNDYPRFLQDFGTNISERQEAYENIATVLNERLPDSYLKEDFNQVYEEFVAFLSAIVDSQTTTTNL